jgi:YD repeat-containing protein
MATILDPSVTTSGSVITAVPVHTNQMLRLVADGATNWYQRTNAGTTGAWTQVGTNLATFVWVTPSTVTNRFTFDDVQIQVGSSTPLVSDTGGLHLNLIEGPAPVLTMTPRIRNEALAEPPAHSDMLESDDPPLGFPLGMPGANRDGLGTVLLERAYEAGGPANLVSLYGPGLFLDSSGMLGQRTPVGQNRGLGIVPSIASYHYGSFYFIGDFGRSRTLSLTRIAYEDGSGNANVGVVRGDGRRNTYRYFNYNSGSGVTYYTPAALLQNSFVKSGNYFLETLPSGTYYVYNSTGTLKGKPVMVLDRYGNPIYFLYDANNKLQKIQAVPGANRQGLVPYLYYDANGRLSTLCLEDYATAANNRTSYFTYDPSAGTLIEIKSPELCATYFSYDSNFNLLMVKNSENFFWKAYYDYNSGGSTGARATAIVDALGQPAYYSYTYYTSDVITTWVDRAGKATYFQPNAYGSPLAVWSAGTPADYFQYENYFVADRHVVDTTQSGSLLWTKNRLGNSWYYQYDSVGNRIAMNDPLTARSYWKYDSAKFVLRNFEDPLFHDTYLAYDGNRNVVFRIDPLGNTTYYAYAATGLTYYKQDRRGGFTYFVFDAAANLTAIRDPLNNATYYNYNSAGDRIDMIDPLGRVWYWNYDKKSRVISTFDPLFAATYSAYDAACNLITQVDPRNNTTYHTYDANDNRTQTTTPLGNATYFEYDPEDRLKKRKDARLNATSWTYDILGRRQNQTDPFANVKYWAYDAAHEVCFTLDELKNASYLDYDVTGRVAHQVDAFLNRVYFGYDLNGNRVKTIDKNGNTTITYYEPRDLVAYTQNAVGAFNYFAYDPELNRTATVDALGQVTYTNYDLRGLVTNLQDPYKNFTYWNYDSAWQRTLQLLPPQNNSTVLAPTYWDYDLAGRQQNTKDSYLNVSYMTYDRSGNLILALNQRQATNSTVFQYFVYDAENRQLETRNLGELRTYYYFDSVGNRVQVDQEQGFGRQPWGTSPYGGERVTTYFTYDALNRQSTALSAASVYSQNISLTYVGYDAASNRVQMRAENPQGGADKRYSYWTYDLLNRVSTAIDPNAAISGGTGGVIYYGYDPNSNRVLVQDQEGRFSYFTFDAVNRTQNQSDVFGDTTYVVYDLRNSLARRVDPVGRTAYFDFDGMARQIRLSNAVGQVTYMGYDARSERVVSQNPRGNYTYFAYDLLGRLSNQTDALGGVRYLGYDEVGNKVLAIDERNNPTYWLFDQANRVRVMTDALGGQFYYGYDAPGSLRQKTDADGRYTSFGYFGYDASRRPTTMSFDTDPWEYFAYDSLGNLTSVQDETGTFTTDYDFLNRVVTKRTQAGNAYFQYDRTGLRTMTVGPDGGGTYHTYDSAGRLMKASVFDPLIGPGQRATNYSYDASGMRIAKASNGNNVVAYYEYDNAGRTTIINNVNSSLATIAYFFYGRDANGNVTSTTREAAQIKLTGQNVYYTFDALDRLTLEEHKTQTTTYFGWQYNYDPASNRYFKYDEVALKATYYRYNSLNEMTGESAQ